MTDPTPAATALVRATERYSALARVWHDSRPTHTLPFERCVWSECQIERHDALIAALAAAEAPGRVAQAQPPAVGERPMTDPTPAATAREALNECMSVIGMLRSFLLSGESMSADDEAHVAGTLSRARLAAAAEAPGRVAALEQCQNGHNWWPAIGCTRCDARELTGRPNPAPAPTPSEPVARCEGYDLVDRPDLAPNIVCALPAGHVGYHNPAPAPTPSEPVEDIRECLDCGAPVRMADIGGSHLDDRLDDTHTPHVARIQPRPTPGARDEVER